ncbi:MULTISPECIES: NAD-dependent epimerase/dehydratase family protein [unclassified Pseudomonas]|uniref:NAD-dependent epimerase/dehydratase family protein n=1 Tax=unclassified Pseudomonas TaxID=196821 RepID=UPI0011EEB473|nr:MULTISPECIES: NAD-dependent epimerase/dehydratase family protein [unclassified Pseudomonas]KAA0943424.1 epimerase [Pseudomonas sp. ANT_H4]KAA0949913.1 epimerase [Pseudomonas sp. ANT_H14]
MRVLLFGATGMVGQGVLRECLLASDVQEVVAVGRTSLVQEHGKLHQVLHADMFDFQPLEHLLQGFDACLFCLGVSSVGMDEATYTRQTYDLTLVAASTLARLNPHMTFIYVSGAGTDSSETGKVMWGRIKGKTENALLRLPFKAVYLFRPGIIQPLHGVRSKTSLYQSVYNVIGPLLSLIRRVRPAWMVSTETVGRAMLAVVRHGAPQAVIEPKDINRLAAERA